MDIQKLPWQKAKSLLIKANKSLHDAIDKLEITSQYPLYLVEYEYGDIIASPSSEFLHPHSKYGKLWDRIPFSVVLDKKFEFFIQIEGRSFPYRIYDKGMMFKTTRFLESYQDFMPKDIISISAGANNTFLLPKASEKIANDYLSDYFNKDITRPETLNDHHITFKNIAKAAKSKWRAKLLCFSDEWYFKALETKPKELMFLIQSFNNRFDAYFHAQPYYDFLLTFLRAKLQKESITNFVYDIVRQLYSVGCSVTPAYKPVTDDEFLPYSLLSDIYINIYKMKTIPFAMEPAWLTSKTMPVYYSLFKESLIYKPERLPNAFVLTNKIREVFELFNHTIHEMDIYPHTRFRDCADNIKISAFHDKGDLSKKILNTQKDLFKYDKRFEEIAKKLKLPLNFYKSSSPFFTGCVGLRY